MDFPLLQSSIYPFGGWLNVQSTTSAAVKVSPMNSDIYEITF